MSEEKKWYAIYTKSRAEKKTGQTLTELGIDHYLPMQTIVKQWSDRKKKVEEPLFKSYLFVHATLPKEMQTILAINGVVKFVKSGKELNPMRAEVIEAIKLSLLHYTEIETTHANLDVNQKVRIIGGPLKGYEGKTIKKQGNSYFALEIEELGSHMLLKLPSSYLEPI
ncbi:MAG: UpxY family transcription antiterminator [Bacteroidetes bacterium]|nr:MAG: UpxY family transcription antiterminator [Bacteroidota bacterium]